MPVVQRKLVNFPKSQRAISAISKSASTMALEEVFRDSIEPAQLNLVQDLDEQFFANSYLLVQNVSDHHPSLAARFKFFVDILYRLHGHYIAAVEQGKAMQLKVKSADEKLQLALQTTSTSEAMMEHLRESLEDAWRSEDATKNREETMQLQLMKLVRSDQPTLFNRAVPEQMAPTAKDSHIRSLVYRERDRLAGELKDYQKRLNMNRLYSESVEGMLAVSKETIAKLNQRVKLAESENFRLEHKCNKEQEKYEERLLQINKELAHVLQQNQELVVLEKELVELTAVNETLKQRNDRLTRENYNFSKTYRLHEDEKLKMQTSLKMAEDLNNVQRRDKADLEFASRTAERNAKKKAVDSLVLERRFIQLAKKNSELNAQVLANQSEIKVQEKKIMVVTGKLDEAIQEKDDMARARDKLRIEITRLNDIVSGVRHEIAVVRHQMQDLQNDVNRANAQLDEKDLQVQKIAREKREQTLELNDAYKKIDGIEGSVPKTERVEALQLALQQKHQDFANAKKQMEIIHSEKVLLIKTMDMCSRDRSTLQSTMTKLTHQINQMTSSLATNEKEISVLGNQIEQLNRTVKQKQNEIHAKGRLLASTRSDLRETKFRLEQSQLTIDSDEKRFKSMSAALEEVKKEKSLVGLQMVRRNDEVRLQREKLEMMQKAIDRGTLQYNQRLEDIRLLKLEVVNLRMSRECMQREVGNRATMRHHVVRLERQLNQERLRVSAYSEELARPCRIHRWRVLLGKDPRRFELIRKVQHLLRRNIRLSVERENIAKELEDLKRLHEEFKRQIKNLPDPSVRQKLCLQQRLNRRQSRQLKVMKAELRVNEIDLKAREHLIKGLQEQLRSHRRHNPQLVIGGGDGKDSTAETIDCNYLEHVFDFSSVCASKPT
ncbi:cilia- and flagella-associated protein 58 [Drosophila gunungcola]|uniref:cilia- and flagella-associated protein 58 n=1 Tax=Drosophila gunungcola TaxID=103775 RepID=UPI0022E12ECF|nr:cilia- and flagella-associated protein 58 [Drosophila gunungcola]